MRTASVARGLSRFTGERGYGSPASINRTLVRILAGQRALALVSGAAAAYRWRVEREAELWGRVLDASGARVVAGIQPDAGLCRAASARNIPVYDLQHGITETRNDAYYRRLSEDDRRDLPSGFLMWDEDGAKALAAAAERGAEVRIVGNPWFARFLKPDPRDQLVAEAVAALPPVASDRPTVVVTLQHGMRVLSPAHVPNGIMPDALAQAIRRGADRFTWLLRLHPSQTAGSDAPEVQHYLQEHFGHVPSVEWRGATAMPLPLLLARATVHVTHYSATTIEAAWLGVPTALLDPELRPGGRREHLLARERARGVATCVPLEPDAILSFVQAAAESRAVPGSAWRSAESIDAFAASVKALAGSRASRPLSHA